MLRGALIVLVLLGAPAPPAAAQASHCDDGLRQSLDHPAGYRQRGDRCEGVYVLTVGSPALEVVSFTRHVADFEPGGTPLVLGWPVLGWPDPGGAEVHLRALSLDSEVHYRMDTRRPAGGGSYSWPTELVAGVGLGRGELGLLAWTDHPQLGDQVYLPLTAGLSAPAGGEQAATAGAEQAGGYRLLLLPGQTLSRVFVSLAPVAADGSLGDSLRFEEELEGVFFARRPFPIEIAGLPAPGLYRLEVAAILRGGGDTTARIHFLHAPP